MVPVCLYPPHREKYIRHYINDCEACPQADKDNYIAEYRKERGKRVREPKAQRVRKEEHNEERRGKQSSCKEWSSITFSAVFGERQRERICDDNGADGNIMDKDTLRRIESAGALVNVHTLDQPRIFYMAAATPEGTRARLVCTKEVILDIELHIRHGTALKLRNVTWLVTMQRVSEPLLGRPILEELGLNTYDLLASATDRFARSVDAESLVGSFVEQGDGRLALVMEGVFHADGGERVEDELVSANEWCDIGIETEEEWEKSLRMKLAEAEGNGIIPRGLTHLESMLRQHRRKVRVRYNGGLPAHVRPLQLRLNHNAQPVRAKPRQYPAEKRQFLRKYVEQLQSVGLIKPAERAEWVSAPLVVPKKPPAMYRLTEDYRPINAATVKNTWPMPHIDAVLQDVRGAKAFAAIDFTSGYWQLPLHADSQHLHAFMTPDGVMQPTRRMQGECNSTANFQTCVEPCYSELREHLLTWLDDFAIFDCTENGFLRILQRFFELLMKHNLIISLPKSTFFAKEIRWCGRRIDASGVTIDPSNYEGLRNADEPRTAG